MNFITSIRKKLLIKKPSCDEADAIVLSLMPGNKLLLQVLPLKGRNFVIEVSGYPVIRSDFHAGQRVRVKYDPLHQSRVEIIDQSVF